MQRQNGVNKCLRDGLSIIGEQSKKLYDDVTMELMIRMIQYRKTFSDNQLIHAFDWAMSKEDTNILDSALWKEIKKSFCQIVQSGSKKDRMWLKLCLLPSTIWYKDISEGRTQEPHYLYYELLKLVDIEAMVQINTLEKNMNEMADKQKDDWLALVEWSVANEYECARQDKIVNGITSRYTFDQLSASSGSAFQAPNFYDYNEYLSQLTSLAQIGILSASFCVYNTSLYIYCNTIQ